MPYDDERAGLKAIRAIADSGVVDKFKDQLVKRAGLLDLPSFTPCPPGRQRRFVFASDGSSVYERIPGALPCTEAGLVTLGSVVIDVEKLMTLERLPESGSVNPKELSDTESGLVCCAMLPGRNAANADGLSPRQWFRKSINQSLEEANVGGESFAETLAELLRTERKIKCPNLECEEPGIDLPNPGERGVCPVCAESIWLSDGLRIHEQFDENTSVSPCHTRFMDALEILVLLNALRHLSTTEAGREAIANTAFIKDGPLAAFGTVAVLARAARKELKRIQDLLPNNSPGLLVMSGLKSGPFVEHAEELDRAPEPGKRIEPERVWLPRDEYIRAHIVAGTSKESKPWGELTYFGRPVILKTAGGQRLVLNLAQPEVSGTLTSAPPPKVLGDALATAGPLGVGTNQFLPLRRSHAHAAIPFRAGTDLIKSLMP